MRHTCPPHSARIPGPRAAPKATYNADGSGRDTYIRRDPVECFGKNLYRAEPRLITRMGQAGSAVPRERPRAPGQTDPVGGPNGGFPFERPARFLRPKVEEYPTEIKHYTTMKEAVQDAFVTAQQMPGHLNHISSYAGFQPRCPTAVNGSADWTEVSSGVTAYEAAPPEEAAAPAPAE